MIKRRTDERTIDDLKVITTQYSLRESLQLQGVLAKLVLPVLAKLEGASIVGMLKGNAGGQLGAAFEQIAETIEEKQLWPLVIRILSCTQVQVEDDRGPRLVELSTGEKIESVIGELSTLYKILAFVLIHNFRKSFSAASSALPETTPAEQGSEPTTPTPSPTTASE